MSRVDHLETYRNNLHHVVRPEENYDRTNSPHAMLYDWQALALVRVLADYAGYKAGSGTKQDIALSWIEYIKMCIYEENKQVLRIYAHTSEARQVFFESLESTSELPEEVKDDIISEATWLL